MSLRKKVWNDPVGSSVISGVILFVLGGLYSIVKGLLSNTEDIPQVSRAVFSYRVNIWLAIVIVIVMVVVVNLLRKRRTNKKRGPDLPFVNDFTMATFQNVIWTWQWKWSSTYGIYYVTDLSIECPICKKGVLSLDYYGSYRCAKCTANIPYDDINASEETVTKQILVDARNKYSSCKQYIGEMQAGMIKA